MSGRYVTAPAHVAAADLGPVTLLMNYRTGLAQTLTGPRARWWEELAGSGDPDTPSGLGPQQARALLSQLKASGLVTQAPGPCPWSGPVQGPPWEPSWGTHEVNAGYTAPPPVPDAETARAAAALDTVTALAADPAPLRMARLIRQLARAARSTQQPAPYDRALLARHAVQAAGLRHAGRIACIEESAAVFLALAAAGMGVTWRHGAAADPVRLHAWIEAGGRPVGEPPSTSRCAVLRTVPQPDGGSN